MQFGLSGSTEKKLDQKLDLKFKQATVSHQEPCVTGVKHLRDFEDGLVSTTICNRKIADANDDSGFYYLIQIELLASEPDSKFSVEGQVINSD